MDDTYPKRVSDPSADGLPEYADDDSTAYDDVPSPRESDGFDPAPLPPDRDSGPLAMDEFGTTAEEQRQGEPLDLRLSREEPENFMTAVTVPLDDEDPLLEEVLADDPALAEEGPVDPQLDSAVSMYDRDSLAPVGRLVQPDEGAHEDLEGTEIAVDEGAAGGGASAEELAIHEVPPDRLA